MLPFHASHSHAMLPIHVFPANHSIDALLADAHFPAVFSLQSLISNAGTLTDRHERYCSSFKPPSLFFFPTLLSLPNFFHMPESRFWFASLIGGLVGGVVGLS